VGDVVRLHKNAIQVLIVSSGAISAGIKDLKIKERPRDLPLKQATAAVGQIKLLNQYNTFFTRYDIPIAQILLTREDFHDRTRYLNARNTMLGLLARGIIPIINENDTVATEEIKFGDNDTLAALVSTQMEAELLVILTNIEGLYSDDPHKSKKVELLSYVEKITPEIEKLATSRGRGEGGMESKVQAAKMATATGIPVVIAKGGEKGILEKIIQGEDIGSFFVPSQRKKKGKKNWIAFSLKTKGKIIVDEGAKLALMKKGKSLLASGIISAEGRFAVGDAVSIVGPEDKEFAKGLTNYSKEEIEKIKGVNSSELEAILGYRGYDEVVHRDNMVVL